MAESREQRAESKKRQLAKTGFFAFEDLEIYRLSVDLAFDVYKLTKQLPESEKYALTNQLKRASTSVTLNIAEGRGRGTDKDFAKFSFQARGSNCLSIAPIQPISRRPRLTSRLYPSSSAP
jgi:hypothetical protein